MTKPTLTPNTPQWSEAINLIFHLESKNENKVSYLVDHMPLKKIYARWEVSDEDMNYLVWLRKSFLEIINLRIDPVSTIDRAREGEKPRLLNAAMCGAAMKNKASIYEALGEKEVELSRVVQKDIFSGQKAKA